MTRNAPLTSMNEILQTGAMDCGLASAVFLRAGGALRLRAEGQPLEATVPMTLNLVHYLCGLMRKETKADSRRWKGTDEYQICDALDEFAAVYEGNRYDWEVDEEPVDVSSEDLVQGACDAFKARLERLLAESPRCVLLMIRVWLETDQSQLGFHAVVVKEVAGAFVSYHDPAKGPQDLPLMEFFHAHLQGNYWFSKKGAIQISNRLDPYPPVGPITSKIIAAKNRSQVIGEIEAGKTVICEIDAGWSMGENLIAQGEGSWFNNELEADAEAELLVSEGKNCAVIEVPAGSFVVVPVNAVSEINATKGEQESADVLWKDDALLVKHSSQVFSWRLHLHSPVSGTVRVLEEATTADEDRPQDEWNTSHRGNYTLPDQG